MKIKKRLLECLFVMHLQRELDRQQMLGKTEDMKLAVEVAEKKTILTVSNLDMESEAGGNE